MKKTKFRNFGKIKDNFELPQLLDIQVKPYEDFLQRDSQVEKRADQGLEEVFREVFLWKVMTGRLNLNISAII